MSDIAIKVEGLGKEYRIGKKKVYKSLRETLTGLATSPLRHLGMLAHPEEVNGEGTFWALKDVNFEVKRGDIVGIIGRNGAGKSTLLKVLSRITEPTEGQIEISGRVGSLLEVGTGFHPELTGRENVYLNGAILGMKRAEIVRKFDEIVAFSEIEKFLDTPVKHYSSGMYTRLAFAVAAHLEPEILIVDEVLAVGDAGFQKKCLGKMGEVAKEGRTVLFVSHNMSAIRSLCSTGILLKSGQVVAAGSTEIVLDRYASRESAVRGGAIEYESSVPGLGLRDVYFVDVSNGTRTDTLAFAQNYELRIEIKPASTPLSGAAAVTITDVEGNKVSMLVSVEEGLPFFDLSRITVVRFSIPDVALTPGAYRLSVDLLDRYSRFLFSEFAAEFTIEPRQLKDAPWPYTKMHGFCRTSRGVTIEEG
jgi:lipopolysaccharide transport system ATP-binding protein